MSQIDQGGIFVHLEVGISELEVLIDVNFPPEITITKTITTMVEITTMIENTMVTRTIDIITLGVGGLQGEGEIQEVDHLVGVKECNSRLKTPNPPHPKLNHVTDVRDLI